MFQTILLEQFTLQALGEQGNSWTKGKDKLLARQLEFIAHLDSQFLRVPAVNQSSCEMHSKEFLCLEFC